MMKKILLSAFLLSNLGAFAQATLQTVSTGPQYANNAYYNLTTKTQVSEPLSNWDLAFYRKSAFQPAIRINDAKGLQLFEASNNLADWNSISIANQGSWNQLYNSDVSWVEGAFDNGSAAYGFGYYSGPPAHKVIGSVIFVVKEGESTYRKIKIDEFSGGYTFTYSNWSGTAWSADVTQIVPNTENQDKNFNYFSFATNGLVTQEPASTNWDFVFTKYTTDLTTNSGEITKYVPTGILTSPDVKVAKTTVDNPALDLFSANINTIGWDWKTYTGTYTVDSETNYFIRSNTGDRMFKINFVSFEGSSTGNTTFNLEDVSTLSVAEVVPGVSFDVYPNPTKSDKIINVVYDITLQTSENNTVSIYNMNGAKVYNASLSNTSGFYNQQIDLSSLSSGIYMLEFKSGNKSEVKKIILK